jgi:MFS family permease
MVGMVIMTLTSMYSIILSGGSGTDDSLHPGIRCQLTYASCWQHVGITEALVADGSVCGIPWGIFQTLTTAYAAEIVPPNMRVCVSRHPVDGGADQQGYLTAWVSMCWGIGGFLASIILRATLTIEGNWAWRTAYMLQWVWPVPLFIVGWYAPESMLFSSSVLKPKEG